MANQKPSHKAYAVEGDGEESQWSEIGAAWPTKGDGFNIVLKALPTNARIVLRKNKPREE